VAGNLFDGDGDENSKYHLRDCGDHHNTASGAWDASLSSANSHEGMHGIALYSVMALAAAIWLLSLVGGGLLLRRAR
jgi:hypothetical protein